MFFAEDHFDRRTASCVFTGFAFAVPVEPLRKAFGCTRIETFIFAFEDVYVPHDTSIHFFNRYWPFGPDSNHIYKLFKYNVLCFWC